MRHVFKAMQMTFFFQQWGNSHLVSGLLHWALRTVETWCDEVGLLVNLDKTEHVVFTRRRKPPCFLTQLFGVTYVTVCQSSISG